MNHIWVPWEEERNREIKNATRMYKADEVDTDKAKDIARIRELEEEIRTMIEIIENLKREKQERELIIEKMKHIATEALKGK